MVRAEESGGALVLVMAPSRSEHTHVLLLRRSALGQRRELPSTTE